MELNQKGHIPVPFVTFSLLVVALCSLFLGYQLGRTYGVDVEGEEEVLETQDVISHLAEDVREGDDPYIWYSERLISSYSEPVFHGILSKFYDGYSSGDENLQIKLDGVADVELKREETGSIRYSISPYNSIRLSMSELLLLQVLMQKDKLVR